MAGSLEIRLFNFIRSLHQEIVDMRPEDGFSSPRDLELVKEVNKKSAVFDKLQEAMRVYNPDFEYIPKQEGRKDFSKNPRFDTNWKEKARKFDEETFKEEYMNTWNQIKYVESIEELLGCFRFEFNRNVDLTKIIPYILNVLKDRNLKFTDLFLFTIISKKISMNEKDYYIKYDEVYDLFKYSSNLDISKVKEEFENNYLMILTKSNYVNDARILFNIEF